MCVCVCARACVCTCAHGQVCALCMHAMSYSKFSAWCLRKILSLNLELVLSNRLAGQKALRLCLLLSPSSRVIAGTRVPDINSHIQPSMWALDIQTKGLVLVQQTFNPQSHLLSYLICNSTIKAYLI